MRAVWFLLTTLFLLHGCASVETAKTPLGQDSFAQYRQQTLQWITEHRDFSDTTSATRDSETRWNGPAEWLPQDGLRGGVLLVHGLGDSPWSFHDIGALLARHGYLVRTVLLPGHGTRPEDMLHVSVDDWQRVVDEQSTVLRRDLAAMSGGPDRLPVWLGGFSTGANLVLHHAYTTPGIDGLLLFSPAFKASTALVGLTPALRWIRPWLLSPTGAQPRQNAVRYLNTPTNGFAQFYYSSRTAQQDIHAAAYDKPVFMVLAEHDSVLDTPALLGLFHERFTNPHSRLVWYGQLPDKPASRDARVVSQPDRLPQYRISQFSHMGILFAPSNPLYGFGGSLPVCWNGQTTAALQRCQQGEAVWYSDWGYQEADKVHARLTFNPYFDWQSRLMLDVMTAGQPAQPTQASRDRYDP